MKIKKSKRFLALILSLMMVVTSLPFSALTVSAASVSFDALSDSETIAEWDFGEVTYSDGVFSNPSGLALTCDTTYGSVTDYGSSYLIDNSPLYFNVDNSLISDGFSYTIVAKITSGSQGSTQYYAANNGVFSIGTSEGKNDLVSFDTDNILLVNGAKVETESTVTFPNTDFVTYSVHYYDGILTVMADGTILYSAEVTLSGAAYFRAVDDDTAYYASGYVKDIKLSSYGSYEKTDVLDWDFTDSTYTTTSTATDKINSKTLSTGYWADDGSITQVNNKGLAIVNGYAYNEIDVASLLDSNGNFSVEFATSLDSSMDSDTAERGIIALGTASDYDSIISWKPTSILVNGSTVATFDSLGTSSTATYKITYIDGTITFLVNNVVYYTGSASLSDISYIRLLDDDGSYYGYGTMKYLTVSKYTATSTLTENSVMSAFVSKIADSNTYTNMSSAYDAYVAVQAAVDSYTYGTGSQDDVYLAAVNLNTAMNNMEEWSVASVAKAGGANGTVPTFANSGTDDMSSYAGEGFSNLLYSPSTAEEQASGENINVAVKAIYATNTVLLYDGVNDTKMPVMGSAIVTSNKTRYICGIFPSTSSGTDADGIALVGAWQTGNGTDANWNWNWWSGMSNGVSYHPGYNYTTGAYGNQTTSYRSYQLQYSTSWGSFSSATIQYYSNVLEVTDEPDDYSTTYTPYWTFGISSSVNSDADAIYSSSNAITVINYKKLADAISSAQTALSKVTVPNYKEGGLSAYFDALDAATSFDPYDKTTYFNGEDSTSQMVSDLTSLVEALTSATSATYSTDSSDYSSLRNAIAKTATQYSAGNTGYTEESWEAFTTAYEAAQAVIDAVVTDGYVDADGAAAAALALYNDGSDGNEKGAYQSLVTDIDYVDTTELEALIDAIEATDLSYYTSATATALSEGVTAAKEAVWGDEASYGIETSKLEDDEDGLNQLVVTDCVQALNELIAALRFDADALYPATHASSYSITETLTFASDFINSDEYTNYNGVANFLTAYNALQAINNSLSELTYSTISAYEDEVDVIAAAIAAVYDGYDEIYLKFTLIANGTYATRSTATQSLSYTYSNSKEWTVTFDYPYGTDTVMFITNHDGGTFTYGEATIGFGSTVDGSSRDYNGLLTVSIDSPAAASEEFASSSGDDKIPSYDGTTYDGDLTRGDISINNIKISNAVNNAFYNNGLYGYDDNGNQITDIDYDFTDVLETYKNTEAAEDVAYDIVLARASSSSSNDGYGYIYLTGDVNVTIPSTTEYDVSTWVLNTQPKATTYSASSSVGALINCNFTKNLWTGNVLTYGRLGTYTTGVYAIDISNLIDAVNYASTITDSDPYTPYSWYSFQTYLEAAGADYDYGDSSVSTSTILSEMCQRYYDLVYCLNGASSLKTYRTTGQCEIPAVQLAYKQYFASFSNAYDADGNSIDTSYTTSDGKSSGLATYGDTLGDAYADYIPEATDYSVTSEDGSTTTYYTFKGWTIDGSSTVYSTDELKAYVANKLTPDGGAIENATVEDLNSYTYTYEVSAVYESSEAYNYADFTELDDVADTIITNLENNTYSTAQLEAVAEAFNSLTYYYYDDTTREATLVVSTDADGNTVANQTAIDAETATLEALELDAIEIDFDAAAAAMEEAQAAYDSDEYYVPSTTDLNLTTDVTVNGVTYAGSNYASQDDLDSAVSSLLASIQKMTYTIYLNDSAVGTYEYGTAISVAPDGTVDTSGDTEWSSGQTEVAWYYYTTATQIADGAYVTKYMTTSDAFGFIVKGNTYLTTKAVTGDDSGYAVKFVSSVNNKTVDVIYTDADGSFTMPTPKAYAFYTYTGYSNGVAAGETATVSSDTTIKVNYEVQSSLETDGQYTVSVFSYYDLAYDIEGETYSYNDLVTIDTSELSYGKKNNNTSNSNYRYIVAWAVIPDTSIMTDNGGEYSWDESLNMEIIYYGEEYSFYACEDVTLVPLASNPKQTAGTMYDAQENGDISTTNVDYDSGATVYVNDEEDLQVYQNTNGTYKISMIGTYVTPSSEYVRLDEDTYLGESLGTYSPVVYSPNVTMVETGILYNATGTSKDLTLNNASTDSTIKRLVSTQHTVGNQFVISVTGSSYTAGTTKSIQYVSYMKYTYTDENGDTQTGVCYSTPVETQVTLGQ